MPAVWREENCSVESRPEETRPSPRKVRTDISIRNTSQEVRETKTVISRNEHYKARPLFLYSNDFSVLLVPLVALHWNCFWFKTVVFFLPEASEMMRDIGTAIDFLHKINIAHRDIKVQREDDQNMTMSLLIIGRGCHIFFFFCFLSSQRTCSTTVKKGTGSSN